MKVWEKLKTELNHKGLNTLSDNELKKISNNILKRSPRQCPQCGRWFLLNNNKDIKFCSQKCCVDYCNRKDYDSEKLGYYLCDSCGGRISQYNYAKEFLVFLDEDEYTLIIQ